MPEKEVLLTPEGLKKIESKLQYLKTTKRREVAERIKQAIEFGDISENSEYEDAKNEQAFIEGEILKLEEMLRNARVIEADTEAGDTVTLGSKVKLRDIETGMEFEYTIVGSTEANPGDPVNPSISNESPVGRAVLGKRKGDVVAVTVPAGMFRYEIIDVQN